MSSNRPEPMYQQVKTYILEKINSGSWQPGHRIPAEQDLSGKFGTSRLTVHRALRELSDKKLLVRKQGLGSFVAHRKPTGSLIEVHAITDEIIKAGGIYSHHVELLQAEQAPTHIARSLKLPPGNQAFHSIVIHKSNDIPVQYEERWVNPAIASGYLEQDFSDVTTGEYLDGISGPLQRVHHILEAILPNSATCKLLHVEPNEPCLLLMRKTWAMDLVATDNNFIYPGSRYRFEGDIEM